ncbi:MAG: GNAT family N-acetyltransferase [Bacillota bacterium]|nr:GNAT family N-acetyltransferase [Bacillota bacterium]
MSDIRKADISMAGDLGYLQAKAWQAAYTGIVPDEVLKEYTPENRAAVFKKNMPEKPEEYYVLYIDDKPAGFLILGTSRDKDVKPGTGEIDALYLLSEYWDKGFGTRLMQFAISRLRELNYNDITLWVFEKNTRAIRFYERQGFSFDSATMVLTLGKPLTGIRYKLCGDV